MTVEDDRDNSSLEEQVFGVILLVSLFRSKTRAVELFNAIKRTDEIDSLTGEELREKNLLDTSALS
jgi:hypothetical protein